MDVSPMDTIVPRRVISLAEDVKAAGGRAMLVGGCVRDELMGIEPKDWDLEVYGVQPEKLREILNSFGEVNVVGEAFTVYKIGNDLDVSIPRRERKVARGHRGANHPVKDLETGKIDITSQNHGFAVDEATLPANVRVTRCAASLTLAATISLTDAMSCVRPRCTPVIALRTCSACPTRLSR